MESVAPVGKPTFANTTWARRVASRRFCSSDRWSRSSVRTATAIPCMARFSLISLGVCMLERESPLRQVTQVTTEERVSEQLAPGCARIHESSEMRDHESQCEAHNRNTPKRSALLIVILSQAGEIEQD